MTACAQVWKRKQLAYWPKSKCWSLQKPEGVHSIEATCHYLIALCLLACCFGRHAEGRRPEQHNQQAFSRGRSYPQKDRQWHGGRGQNQDQCQRRIHL